MDRLAIISKCDDCPFFDNNYWGYNRLCNKLGRKIEVNEQTGESEILKIVH